MEERRRYMDKLKVKHDHKLTDILKVGLFGIFLLLPLLVWLPNALYFGFNEHANNVTKTVAKKEIVDFNQWIPLDQRDYENQYVDSRNYFQLTIQSFYNGVYVGEIYHDYSGVNPTLGVHNYIVDTIHQCDTLVIKHNGSAQDLVICTFPINANLNDKLYFNLDYVSLNPTVIDELIVYNNMCTNLTQMYGIGNEPTINEFKANFPNEYYEYTKSKYIEITTNETITVLAATDNMELAWQDVWNLPVFEWTGRNNFNFTINLFTNIFGITEYSYLTNYLTYILVMTAIYVIFDIVLSMFKLVTHLINSKE